MQRILVTGAAGFIGSYTVNLLLESGYQVIAFDNLSQGNWARLPTKHTELQCVTADLLDLAALSTAVASVDAVLHLAACVSVPESIADPLASFKVNSQGFLHLLEAICRQEGRDIRLVYASSAAVYGDNKSPCTEDKFLSGGFLSPYALQKFENEQYSALYQRLMGVQSIGLRYFNVYGLGQQSDSPYAGVISKFLDAYIKNKPFRVFGDGLQTRDFIHVRDVARANVLALESSLTGVFNIATGVPESLLELVRCFEKIGKQNPVVEFYPARLGDIMYSVADTNIAELELGFSHVISLQQGIASLVEGLSGVSNV